MKEKLTLLVVDDRPANVALINEYLEFEDYIIINASNGQEALTILERQAIDLLLLDWMMPKMTGMELLRIIKRQPEFENLLVIMQTAKTHPQNITEGMAAGAYYYLTKPYSDQVLISVLKAASRDLNLRLSLQDKIDNYFAFMRFIDFSSFSFQTMEEARCLALGLTEALQLTNDIRLGLVELFFNAIEHGNLGITYDEKTELINEGILIDEIKRRLVYPENLDKKVVLEMEKTPQSIIFRTKDRGQGFDYEKYLVPDKSRLFDNHGRGIAISNHLFNELKYLGCGNEVKAVIDLPTSSNLNSEFESNTTRLM